MSKPFIYWCWKCPYLADNQLRAGDCFVRRSEAIADCEMAYAMPWKELKREGFSVVKVVLKVVE